MSDLKPSQQMAASSVGAFFVALFATPFDVVKVRLQAQLKIKTVKCSVFNELVESICYCSNPPLFNSPVLCAIHGNIRTIPRFSSSFDAFFKIAKLEGVGKLWKGLSPTLIQMVPQTVIYFTAYDQLKMRFHCMEMEEGFVAPLSAGVISRSFAVLCVSPIEMLRTKLQSKKNMKYRELYAIVRTAIKEEGFACMWKGVGPTLFRDVPFSGLYWLLYETLKSYNSDQNLLTTFFSGSFAGMMAAVFTQPFDVVKTYRQIELGDSKNVKNHRRFTFLVMAKLYRANGKAGLFTGVYPRVLKVSLACAIMISAYEYGKKHFAYKNASLLTMYDVVT